MTKAQLFNQIVNHGIVNKKKKDEIYAALIKSGQFDASEVATDLKSLDDNGAFGYATAPQQEEPQISGEERYKTAMKFAQENKESEDVNLRIRANKFLEDVNQKRILPNGYKVENEEVRAILENPRLFNELTPGRKSDMIPELSKAGFKFPKQLNATQEEAQANAEAALGALQDMQVELFDDSGNKYESKQILAKLGRGKLATMLKSTVDPISRIRTGAALTESEVRFYESLAPQVLDTPEEARYKMEQLEMFFSGIAGSEIQLRNNEGKIVKYDDMFDPRQRREARELMNKGYRIYRSGEGDVEFGEVVNDPSAAVQQSQQRSTGITQETSRPGIVGEKTKDTIEKVGDFLGVSKFAKGIGTTLFLNSKYGKELMKKAEQGDKASIEALNEVVNETPTNKEIVGSAALTALNATSGGVVGKGASALSKIASGAGVGAAYGAAGAAEQNEGTKEIVKSGAIGATVGGTMTAVGVGFNKLKNAIKEKGGAVAERIYGTAVKPSLDDIRKTIKYNGNSLSRELIDEGIKGGDKKIYARAITELDKNENKLQDVLHQNKDVIIKKAELVPYLEKLKARLANTPTTKAQKELKAIDKALDLFPDEFSVVDANKFKRNIYNELQDVAYKIDPKLTSQASINKAIANGLKTEIEKKVGSSVKEINSKLGIYRKLQDSVLDNLARKTRNQIAGVGTLGAVAEKVLGTTGIKTRGAVAIDRISQKIGSIKADTAGKITKSAVMNLLREMTDNKD